MKTILSLIIASGLLVGPALAQDALTVPTDPKDSYSIRSDESPDLFLGRDPTGSTSLEDESEDEDSWEQQWELRSKYPELYSGDGVFQGDDSFR